MVHGVLIHKMRYIGGLGISLVSNVVYEAYFKDLQVEMCCQYLDMDIWGSEERAVMIESIRVFLSKSVFLNKYPKENRCAVMRGGLGMEIL